MAKKKIQPLFGEIIPPKKEKAEKSIPDKKTIAKKEPVGKNIEKEIKKTTPKKSPEKKEVKTIKPKEVKVVIPEIEDPTPNEEILDPKPSYVKEAKRKPKVDKNEPPKNLKHKLKVGQKVIATFLGDPRRGEIIELSIEGMYKVKTDSGIILPRAKHEEEGIPDKSYPSYIIKVL
jgi:hypothetical protein